MSEYKISGYVKITFSKIIECENYADAREEAEKLPYNEDIDFADLDYWYDYIEVEEIEEL